MEDINIGIHFLKISWCFAWFINLYLINENDFKSFAVIAKGYTLYMILKVKSLKALIGEINKKRCTIKVSIYFFANSSACLFSCSAEIVLSPSSINIL